MDLVVSAYLHTEGISCSPCEDGLRIDIRRKAFGIFDVLSWESIYKDGPLIIAKKIEQMNNELRRAEMGAKK